ncbi:hypothetical protein K6959_16030 [Bacillus aquiflavi]|nr:hypothetical protein [Bacillus aquiflavi]UAC48070.1 hypothetical protein K6959_16030 [Bacillus aquiflavi]
MEKLEKLKALLSYAKGNSNFYHKQLSNFNPEELDQDIFTRIPILYKEDIIGKEETLLTISRRNNLTTEYTSGSTGSPLKCYKGISEVLRKTKDLWTFRKENARVNPKDLYAMFYAFTENDLKTDKIQLVDNALYLSMLNMSHDNLNDYYEALKEYKPKWLLGVPSALYIFSNHIIKNNYNINELSIKYVEANGEMLFDYQKKAIQRAFGPILYNHYGCREFWCLGMSCHEGNMHILNERFYYEVVNVDEKGIGELVVTDLSNKTWPLIRYHIGDLVHKELMNCSCGNESPIIKITGGRSQDYLKIEDWTANPILFHYVVIKMNRLYPDSVRQFKIIQAAEKVLLMELVPGKNYSRMIKQKLKEEIKERLPNQTEFKVIERDFIPNKFGKFKYFETYKRKENNGDGSKKSAISNYS